jgi:hypothetical protein
VPGGSSGSESITTFEGDVAATTAKKAADMAAAKEPAMEKKPAVEKEPAADKAVEEVVVVAGPNGSSDSGPDVGQTDIGGGGAPDDARGLLIRRQSQKRWVRGMPPR